MHRGIVGHDTDDFDGSSSYLRRELSPDDERWRCFQRVRASGLVGGYSVRGTVCATNPEVGSRWVWNGVSKTRVEGEQEAEVGWSAGPAGSTAARGTIPPTDQLPRQVRVVLRSQEPCQNWPS